MRHVPIPLETSSRGMFALTSFVFGLAVGGCLGRLYATMGLPVGPSFRVASQSFETAARI